MTQKWNDHAGEVIYNSIEVMQKFAEFLKNDIALIAEKERSVGFLNEQMSDTLFEMSQHQFPKAKEVLNLFIASLSQIEYSRKVMYQRDHQLADNAFVSSIELAKGVKELLKNRENAIRKYTSAKASNKGPADQNLVSATAHFQQLNTQSIQAAGTYANQLHRDLITTLASYAHSQMELHAKQLETWAKYIDIIDSINLDEDVENTVQALKDSVAVYANQT